MNTMMLNTKKFKNQLNGSLISPFLNHLQQDVTDIKQLYFSIKDLGASLKELQASTAGVKKFTTEIERQVNRWQFKSEPAINKIQQLTKQLKKTAK